MWFVWIYAIVMLVLFAWCVARINYRNRMQRDMDEIIAIGNRLLYESMDLESGLKLRTSYYRRYDANVAIHKKWDGFFLMSWQR